MTDHPTSSKSSAVPPIPPEPGTAPIPEGNIRLYHYTGADPEQLRQQGLLMSQAKGGTYGEPDQIWGSARPPSFDNHNVVEFSVPRDDPRWDIGKYEPYINYGDGPGDPNLDYGQYLHDRNAHVTFHGDIRPEEIHAVHEPWHQSYRYLMQHYLTPDTDPNQFDWALAPATGDPQLGRAVQAWKQSLWPKQAKVASTVGSLYKRWVFSPASGQVTIADNSGDPLDVKYHTDLASELNEPGLVHGYAYRLGDGWRLTDWDSKPLEDPYVVAQVMRQLQATQGSSAAQDAPWEPSREGQWDRVHLGLPS